MRVNSRVLTEKSDLLGGIQIPNCPSQFRVVAERLMMMATKPGYSVGDYNTMTELDKILMLDYWREYDGLTTKEHEIYYTQEQSYQGFKQWFVHKATAPELIRRARQWLVEHQYLIPRSEVSDRAFEAGEKFTKAIRQ